MLIKRNGMIWTIKTLDVKAKEGELENVVVTAHWDCVHENVRHYSATSFDAPTESFTKYEDLTQEQVLEWVWEKVGKENIEALLVKKYEEKKNPPIRKLELPWSEA